MYDKISTAVDHKEHAIRVFLDLSKAFDTVNHDILFDKLEHGIRGLMRWIGLKVISLRGTTRLKSQTLIFHLECK